MSTNADRDREELDREALASAARVLRIDLSEPGAEEAIRPTYLFARVRLSIACRELGRAVVDGLPDPIRRRLTYRPRSRSN